MIFIHHRFTAIIAGIMISLAASSLYAQSADAQPVRFLLGGGYMIERGTSYPSTPNSTVPISTLTDGSGGTMSAGVVLPKLATISYLGLFDITFGARCGLTFDDAHMNLTSNSFSIYQIGLERWKLMTELALTFSPSDYFMLIYGVDLGLQRTHDFTGHMTGFVFPSPLTNGMYTAEPSAQNSSFDPKEPPRTGFYAGIVFGLATHIRIGRSLMLEPELVAHGSETSPLASRKWDGADLRGQLNLLF